MRLQHSYNKSKKHSMQMSVVRKCNTKISENAIAYFLFILFLAKELCIPHKTYKLIIVSRLSEDYTFLSNCDRRFYLKV